MCGQLSIGSTTLRKVEISNSGLQTRESDAAINKKEKLRESSALKLNSAISCSTQDGALSQAIYSLLMLSTKQCDRLATVN